MTRTFQGILGAAAGLMALTAALAAKPPAGLLAVGAAAPAYTLPDQDGATHTLAQDKGHAVLLAFYPADATAGCTIEAHSLSGAYKDLAAQGVRVYGVSVQDPHSHKAFCTKEGIPYTLLADTQKTISRSYGVLGMGGYDDRVTYVIGPDGKVAYVDPNVNGHLFSCGPDWVAWFKAHPAVAGKRSAGREWKSESILTAFLQTPAQVRAVKTAAVSKPAPVFTLADVQTGQKTSLAALGKGKKATVVMFISTQCPISNAYDGRMISLAKKYEAEGVAFVGINANQTEPVAECASHAQAHHFPFPVLKDGDDAVADAYNAHVTPETYVINAQGVLVYHGRIDSDIDPADAKAHDLTDALNAVLAGRPVPVAQTKAFGCTIKREKA